MEAWPVCFGRAHCASEMAAPACSRQHPPPPPPADSLDHRYTRAVVCNGVAELADDARLRLAHVLAGGASAHLPGPHRPLVLRQQCAAALRCVLWFVLCIGFCPSVALSRLCQPRLQASKPTLTQATLREQAHLCVGEVGVVAVGQVHHLVPQLGREPSGAGLVRLRGSRGPACHAHVARHIAHHTPPAT